MGGNAILGRVHFYKWWIYLVGSLVGVYDDQDYEQLQGIRKLSNQNSDHVRLGVEKGGVSYDERRNCLCFASSIFEGDHIRGYG